MSSRPTRSLATLAALADPVRRALYEFVVAQGDAVDRDSAAAGVGIARPLAAFHLDRLVREGLLDAEYRRRSERSGPGAGRPAKFYRRASATEVEVSLPPRRYDAVAEILAAALEKVAGGAHAAREEASAFGATRGRAAGSSEPLETLARDGYEPTAEPDGTVRLRNCPFRSLVDAHRDLVCAVNLATISGMARGGGWPVTAVSAPREGYCCVALEQAGTP